MVSLKPHLVLDTFRTNSSDIPSFRNYTQASTDSSADLPFRIFCFMDPPRVSPDPSGIPPPPGLPRPDPYLIDPFKGIREQRAALIQNGYSQDPRDATWSREARTPFRHPATDQDGPATNNSPGDDPHISEEEGVLPSMEGRLHQLPMRIIEEVLEIDSPYFERPGYLENLEILKEDLYDAAALVINLEESYHDDRSAKTQSKKLGKLVAGLQELRSNLPKPKLPNPLRVHRAESGDFLGDDDESLEDFDERQRIKRNRRFPHAPDLCPASSEDLSVDIPIIPIRSPDVYPDPLSRPTSPDGAVRPVKKRRSSSRKDEEDDDDSVLVTMADIRQGRQESLASRGTGVRNQKYPLRDAPSANDGQTWKGVGCYGPHSSNPSKPSILNNLSWDTSSLVSRPDWSPSTN